MECFGQESAELHGPPFREAWALKLGPAVRRLVRLLLVASSNYCSSNLATNPMHLLLVAMHFVTSDLPDVPDVLP